MESTVDGKATRVSVVAFLILLAAAGAAAQRPSNGQPLAPARPQTLGAELSLEMSGRGSVIVRVVGTHNAPLREQAFVRIFEPGSTIPLKTAATSGLSEASFGGLPHAGRYVIEVSAPGYLSLHLSLIRGLRKQRAGLKGETG